MGLVPILGTVWSMPSGTHTSSWYSVVDKRSTVLHQGLGVGWLVIGCIVDISMILVF